MDLATEIKDKTNIVDVVSEYVPLVQKGQNHFGVCPFHDDHSPSMSVSNEKQIYTCFSCGASGNVYNFLMDFKHINFKEALTILGEKVGITINNNGPKRDPRIDSYLKMYELAAKLYQNNINTALGKEAKAYLHKREISDDLINEFRIGLAIKEKDVLVNVLKHKEFDLKSAGEVGLVADSTYGYFDIFVNRIMFPLSNEKGEVVGYNGRIYTEGDDNAKYVNTRETAIFKKGKLLFNYFKAETPSRMSKSLIIVEGHIDAIRLWSVGIKNVVASQGTAFTNDQAKLAIGLSKNIILCFDGDKAGRKATFAASKTLETLGANVKIVQLPDKTDPDEFTLKHGHEGILKKISNPVSVLDFKLNYFKEGLNLKDVNDLSAYIKKVTNELKDVDLVMRKLIYLQLSEDLKVPIEIFSEEREEDIPPPIDDYEVPMEEYEAPVIKTVVPKKKVVRSKIKKKHLIAEQRLIYHMLKDKRVIAIYETKIAYLPTAAYRVLACEIVSFVKKHQFFDKNEFKISISSHPELLLLISKVEKLKFPDNYTENEIEDYIALMNDLRIDDNINFKKSKQRNASSLEEKAAYGDEILKYRKLRGEVNDKN